MANEIEIIVKSKDQTDFSAIGAKAKEKIRESVKDSVKAADTDARRGFADAGEHSGGEFSRKFDERTRHDVSRSLETTVHDVEVKTQTKFREIGDKSGRELSHGLGSGVQDVEKGFSLAERAGQAFERSLSSLGEATSNLQGMWRLLPGAIVTGLAVLPAALSAVGGALTIGLGGALAFVGMKAQASSADVKAAFSDMREHVVSETKKISAPFHSTLLHVADDARKAFDSMAPALSDAFAKIAPAVSKFSGQFAASLSKLNPMIRSIGTSFSKVLGSLGSQMPAIMNNFGTSIKAITDAVAANPGAFSHFVRNVSLLTRGLGDGMGFLIRYSREFTNLGETVLAYGAGPLGIAAQGFYKINSAMGNTGPMGSLVAKALAQTGAAAGGAQSALHGAGDATQQLLTAQAAAAMTSDQLKAALDRLTNTNQTAFDAQTQYAQALADANKRARESNAGLNANTAAGRQNRAMLSQLAGAIRNNIEAGKLSAKQIESERKAFISAAEGMGASKKQAKALADQLLGISGNIKKIPSKKSVHLSAKDSASGPAKHAQSAISRIKGKIVKIAQTGASAVAGAVSHVIGTIGRLKGKIVKVAEQGASAATSRVTSLISSIRRLAGKFVRVGARVSGIGSVWSLVGAIGSVVSKTVNIVAHKIGFGHGGVVGSGGYAHGGLVGAVAHAAGGGPRGARVLVGEQGPELVDLPFGSRVRSNSDSRAALAGGQGGGEMRVVLEWAGGNAGDDFMRWLRKNIRIRAGSGSNSVQKALGG